ncbi:TauD/TfdA family dioxygenase [Pseudorhodoferax sp.]|uniref:TauD/TfdA family dioxygenase n=1 Tax=Pseudorhodoferax sp. TaxID=1993553 RepID=UPI0039E5EDE2
MPSHPMEGAEAWVGADLAQASDWLFHLDGAVVEELDRASRRLLDAGVDPLSIRREDFDVPSWREDLVRLRDVLENGRGVVKITGLPVQRFGMEQLKLLWLGIGALVGTVIPQNPYGDALENVMAEPNRKVGMPNVRAYTTDSRLRFHADDCDILGLLCVRPAKSGGENGIVSSMSVFNELLRTRPEVLPQLFRGYVCDLFGDERPGYGPVTDHPIPVFSWHAGRLSCRYSRNYINMAAKRLGTTLGEEEVQAADAFEKASEDARLRYDLRLDAGDIMLLNNATVMHARTEYVDHDEPERRRHLLRLWLRADHGRPLAPDFENRYGGEYSFRLGMPVSRKREPAAAAP